MAYTKWNERKIRQQMRYLKRRYDFTKDERFLEDYNGLVTFLDGDIRPFSIPFTFQDGLIDDANALELYFDFLDDIEDFAKNNADKLAATSLPKITSIANLTPSLILDFLRDFFYDFDEDFGKIFDRVYKERFNNLMFSDDRSISFHIPSLKYTYINITKDDSADDFINAVHEYTHAIVDYICYREPEESYPFCELVSMFMELIAADYLMDCFLNMDDDVNTLRIAQAKNLVIYAENISIERNYFFTHDDVEDKKKFVTDIHALTGKSKGYIKRLLDKTAMEKLSYTIPYLTAIELYYLYQEDKEYCVDLIKYLMVVNNKENYNLDLNDNGVILNEHSTEWVDTIIKRKKG